MTILIFELNQCFPLCLAYGPKTWEAPLQCRRHPHLKNMPQELQETYLKIAQQPGNLRMFHDKAAQRMRDFRISRLRP